MQASVSEGLIEFTFAIKLLFLIFLLWAIFLYTYLWLRKGRLHLETDLKSQVRETRSHTVTPAEPVITEYFCFCREKRKWCPK